MSGHIGDDPQALAGMIAGLGGTIVDDSSFSFPVAKVTEAVPQLNRMGIDCTTIRQYVATNPRSGKTETIAVFSAYKRQDRMELRGKGYTGSI